MITPDWGVRLEPSDAISNGAGMVKPSRRLLFSAMAAAVPAAAQNRAGGTPVASVPLPGSQTGRVISGRDGWLFGAWEDVRRVDLRRTRDLCLYLNGAIGIIRDAGLEVALCITPTKARIYQEFLPADFQPSGDAIARYGVLMEVLARSQALRTIPVVDQTRFNHTRARLLFYNATTGCPAAGLVLYPDGQSVFADVQQGTARMRNVNPVSAQVRVVCGASRSAPFALGALEAGGQYCVWMMMVSGQPIGSVTRDTITPWRP